METTYFGENNVMMIFVITIITIITYTNFTEAQRFFLIYLLAYGTAFWDILGFRNTAILLLITTFIYLEYMTEDRKKIEIIVRIDYKLVDYVYMMLYQYHIGWIVVALGCLWVHKQGCYDNDILFYLSLLLLFVGEHKTISQKFKVACISDILQAFDEKPIYSFSLTNDKKRKFNMLCAFEDKSYFFRKKSYSCFSLEYMLYSARKIMRDLTTRKFSWKRMKDLRKKKGIVVRGYSTPEMQLLRTLGVQRGYERYKVRRKFYEIIYSKIIFDSLLRYYRENTYKGLENFRYYLLEIYISKVPVRINGKKYNTMESLFNGKPYYTWEDEEMFVACLGLSFRKVSEDTLALYNDVVLNFHLNKEKVREISKKLTRK